MATVTFVSTKAKVRYPQSVSAEQTEALVTTGVLLPHQQQKPTSLPQVQRERREREYLSPPSAPLHYMGFQAHTWVIPPCSHASTAPRSAARSAMIPTSPVRCGLRTQPITFTRNEVHAG
ncbi:hypothetical protein ACQP1G_06030 [Nocardia sp. CA-107356]|uniref:hypothetical protein n=1 Tax=Nocardia sp. CA-107356 TaxID=3239972 RepID=UPI003D90DF59